MGLELASNPSLVGLLLVVFRTRQLHRVYWLRNDVNVVGSLYELVKVHWHWNIGKLGGFERHEKQIFMTNLSCAELSAFPFELSFPSNNDEQICRHLKLVAVSLSYFKSEFHCVPFSVF